MPTSVLRASDFRVNPTKIVFTAKSSSALLSLRNTSAESLRFQVGASAWEQSPEGEIVVSPTEDIVVFPTLVTVAPGAQRNIRIGRITGFGEMEKSYRVFIEELPPQNKGQATEKPQIQMLTRMGVPVFLAPQKPRVESRFEELAVRLRILTFKLKNTGNSHFIPQELSVKGLGEKGETIFFTEPKSWYILAGGHRAYRLELPKEDCGKARTITIEAKVANTVLKDDLPMAPGACAE